MSVHSKMEPPLRANRTRVLMIGALVTSAGTHKVTIRNVSRTGAHIASKDKLPAEGDVLLKRGSLFAAAQIVWVRGDEAGVTFYRELSPREVAESLPGAVQRGSD